MEGIKNKPWRAIILCFQKALRNELSGKINRQKDHFLNSLLRHRRTKVKSHFEKCQAKIEIFYFEKH